MKRILILSIAFVCVALLIANRRSLQDRATRVEAAESGIGPRSRVTALPRSSQSAGRPSPAIFIPDAERLPDRAQRILQNALKSFELAELEKRRAEPGSYTQTLVAGCQRKLFLDDYNYAALISGGDGARASGVYSNLLEQAASMSDADLERQFSEPLDQVSSSGHEGAEQMQHFYSVALSSPNPGYSNVLEALRLVAPDDPTTSDLLKDGLTYVSARTQIAREIKEREADDQSTRKWLIENNADPTTRSNALARYDETRAQPTEKLQSSQQALTRLLADRLARNHGLDAETVIELLNRLSLSNVGPEIWIQAQ
jgi:hypothetical protein